MLKPIKRQLKFPIFLDDDHNSTTVCLTLSNQTVEDKFSFLQVCSLNLTFYLTHKYFRFLSPAKAPFFSFPIRLLLSKSVFCFIIKYLIFTLTIPKSSTVLKTCKILHVFLQFWLFLHALWILEQILERIIVYSAFAKIEEHKKVEATV